MGQLSEFSFPVQLFLRGYPWRKIEPVPWTPLLKTLKECRLALISSAGFVMPGQPPFDQTSRGGDTSFREIPNEVDVQVLIDTQPSDHFDHTGMQQDPNVAFPIDRIKELVTGGRIGSANIRHLSFDGAILAPGRLIKESAPMAARRLVEDGVDIALLVPV